MKVYQSVVFPVFYIVLKEKSQDGGVASFSPTHFLSQSLPTCLSTRAVPKITFPDCHALWETPARVYREGFTEAGR